VSDDRLLIHEVVHRHGHLVDEGRLDELADVFTADVRYDVTALGGTVLVGPAAVADAGRALGEGNPVGHHVTNVVVTELAGDRAHAVSKALGVRADGTVGSLVYDDDLVRTPDGWRIAHRRILPRRTPLEPSG
jgi:hypothetical protein